MYARTHLAQSDEFDVCVLIESKWRNVCFWHPFCVTCFFHILSEFDAHDK